MNKTVAFIIIGAVVLVGIIGSLILTLERPDASATFISQVVLLSGILTTAAGTIYGLGKIGEKVDEVKKQTNGTLSARDAQIKRLQDERDGLLIEVTEHRTAATARPGSHRAPDDANE